MFGDNQMREVIMQSHIQRLSNPRRNFEFDQLKRIISVLIITEKLKVNYIEVVCSLSSQIIKSFFHSRLTNMFFIKLVLPSS